MIELLQYIRTLVCWPVSVIQAEVMKLGALLGLAMGIALGDMGSGFYALIALIILDCVTGVIAAAKAKSLATSISFKGLAKKFTILGIVFLAWLIDEGMQMSVLCNMAIMMYSANEGLSILENLDRCGWGQYIPAFLKDKIRQIQERKTGSEVPAEKGQ